MHYSEGHVSCVGILGRWEGGGWSLGPWTTGYAVVTFNGVSFLSTHQITTPTTATMRTTTPNEARIAIDKVSSEIKEKGEICLVLLISCSLGSVTVGCYKNYRKKQ